MSNKIQLVRGTSKTYRITVTDENKNPYTLQSGERIIFGVKKEPEDEALLIVKNITECTDGVCTVKISPDDTISLPYGRYIYDVGLESGDDYFPVIKTSPFVVLPNVTKWGDGL